VKGKITKTVNPGTSERCGVAEGLEATNSVVAFLGSSSYSLREAGSQKDIFQCVSLSRSAAVLTCPLV
jgi:hypothetical protein